MTLAPSISFGTNNNGSMRPNVRIHVQTTRRYRASIPPDAITSRGMSQHVKHKMRRRAWFFRSNHPTSTLQQHPFPPRTLNCIKIFDMPPRKKASDAAPAAPTRVSARVKKAQDDAAASTTVPAPTAAKPPSKAKAPASKAKAKSKMATVDSGDEEDVPAAAKPASKPKAPVSKPKSKAGKRARADSDEDEDETDSKPVPKKSKKASSSQNVADDADDAKPAKMVTVSFSYLEHVSQEFKSPLILLIGDQTRSCSCGPKFGKSRFVN